MTGTTTTSFDNLGLAGAMRDTAIQHNKVVDDVGLRVALSVQTTAVANTSTTETDLLTYTVAASKIVTNNAGLQVRVWGTTTSNANTKTLKFYFGSATPLSTALTASQAGRWVIDAYIIRTGASAQDVSIELREGTASLAAAKTAHVITTATETETAAIIVKVTGTSGTASNDLNAEGMIVHFIPTATEMTAAKVGALTGTAIA